ncbi:MAG: hypothetical protein HY305_07475, partial [Sphingobacteriales bacterium]|nr:hypothetical protein [Sphingobacteriales bacterium]
YYPIYRNFIWAARASGNFSWGEEKTVYYLGGIDNWMILGANDPTNTGEYKYFNSSNVPSSSQNYAFQALAINLRGNIQNTGNGNNALVFNSEFRLPVFTTLLSRPINNIFLRNFQLTQFVDLGTAWEGSIEAIKRPTVRSGLPPVQVVIQPRGVGPFVGGYGFGARSSIFGYFLKVDAGWSMNGFFKGNPIVYISMGVDF